MCAGRGDRRYDASGLLRSTTLCGTKREKTCSTSATASLAAAWAKKLCGMLAAGQLGDVEECRRAVGYLGERRDRVRYEELRAAGLPIGSGRFDAGRNRCGNL